MVEASKITNLMHENDKVEVVKLSLGFFSQIVGLWYAFHTNLKDMGMCDSWYNIKDKLMGKNRGVRKNM